MSEKYTYEDVIIDPTDPRVEIGKEYIFGSSPEYLLERCNDGRAVFSRLKAVNVGYYEPFVPAAEDKGYPICIRKKEPEKKYVPFDLTKEEDRARLRGAWIRPKDEPLPECQIHAIESDRIVVWAGDGYLTPDELLEFWEFIDGTPCGKPVEEEE